MMLRSGGGDVDPVPRCARPPPIAPAPRPPAKFAKNKNRRRHAPLGFASRARENAQSRHTRLATGLLMTLGKKAAGEAGGAFVGELAGKAAKPAADKAVSFLTGLLTGDAKGAVKGITKDDIAV